MIRWTRLLLAILAVAGVMAARPGMAAPAKDAHHHHHCVEMADEQSSPVDDRDGTPTCCVAAVCAMVQPVFHEQHSITIRPGFTPIALPLRDDLWRTSVRPPPDLRPPIA